MNYVCIFVYLEKERKFLVLETKKDFYFFSFFRLTREFALTLTYRQVQWENQTYVVLWIKNNLCVGLFLSFFERFILIAWERVVVVSFCYRSFRGFTSILFSLFFVSLLLVYILCYVVNSLCLFITFVVRSKLWHWILG